MTILHSQSKVILAACLAFGLLAGLMGVSPVAASTQPQTTVTIVDTLFYLNGEVTYPGRAVQGQLINARTANAVFDDANPATVANWSYADTGKWDAQRNTDEFIAALPGWAEHGVRAVSINLQGGRPARGDQEWDASAFRSDGTLKPAWVARADKAIRAADVNGVVVILGLFYFGQDQRLADETAVNTAVDNAIDWLVDRAYTNVLVEINNEAGRHYDHPILKEDRVHEVIARAQQRSKGRLAVSTSFSGGSLPPDAVIAQSDYVLLHGNGEAAHGITALVNAVRSRAAYQATPKPIVFNEDSDDLSNFDAAVSASASWGYHDRRALQFPPIDWDLQHNGTRAFFNHAKSLAGPWTPSEPGIQPEPVPQPDPAPEPHPDPAAVDPDAPAIDLQPSSGEPGTSVTVTGTNFERGRTEPLLFGDTHFANFRADRRGEFTSTFTVPHGYTGDVLVVAEVGDSYAHAQFTVAGAMASPEPEPEQDAPPEPGPEPETGATPLDPNAPAIDLQPNSGGPGTSVTVTGTNFERGRTEPLLFGDTHVANFRADRRGEFTSTFTVPHGYTGDVLVVAEVGDSYAHAPFALSGMNSPPQQDDDPEPQPDPGAHPEPPATTWRSDLSLAFTHEPATNCQGPCEEQTTIWAAKIDGSDSMPVTAPEGAYDRFPRWSPDGTRLALTRVARTTGAAELVVLTPNGDGLSSSRVTDTASLHSGQGCDGSSMIAAWSPDSTRLAFNCSAGPDAAVHVAAADGSQQFSIPSAPLLADDRPTWSPDGLELAFARTNLTKAFGTEDRVSIWTVAIGADGATNPAALASGARAANHPQWAPDGERILFVETDETSLRTALRTVDRASGALATVYTAASDRNVALYDAAWSPDGTRVAFPAGDGVNDSVVHVATANGATVSAVSPDTALAYAPTWSPDGGRVLFDAVETDAAGVEGHRLASVAADGSSPAFLLTPSAHSYAYDAAWRN